MTTGLRATSLLLFGLLAALAVFAGSSDSTAQTVPPPFEPGGMICLDNYDTATDCDGDPSPGSASDFLSRFCIGWNDDCTAKDSPVKDSNFGPLASFVPPSVTVAKGGDLPLGAIGGRLTADATLGLLNGSCSSTTAVSFTLMNASVDTANTIAPRAVGEKDVMTPLAEDKNPVNGLPDGVDKYPAYLSELIDTGAQPRARLFGATRIAGSWIVLNFLVFEPGAVLPGPESPITMKSELGYPSVTVLQDPTAPAAQSAISDFCAPLYTQINALGRTRDNPCTPSTPSANAGCPGQAIIENRGYPLLPCETGNTNDEDGDGKINDGCPQNGTIAESGADCDNNTNEDTEDSDVNDGCPPFGALSEGTLIPDPEGCDTDANEASCAGRQLPSSAGTFTFTTYASSQRDYDGDGFENSLDVCWDKYNPGWEPRLADLVNDADGDGLPKECDPDPAKGSKGSAQSCPAGYTGPDEDQDCFSNRQDNCPLVNQLADPSKPPAFDNKPNPVDDDSDGIGDACDPNKTKDNGAFDVLCLSFTVEVGAGVSTAPKAGQKVRDPNCALSSGTIDTGGGPTPTLPPGATPRPSGTSGTANPSGVIGPPDGGVGSLSPTGTEFPVWAAILAGLGAIGVLSGVTLLSRLAPRRGRR